MYTFLLSNYNRMYFFYRNQTNNIKSHIHKIIQNYKLFFIINYGKIMGRVQQLTDKVEDNLIYSYVKKIINVFQFNKESTTHWIRTTTYYFPIEETPCWFNLFNNNRFVTVYSSPNFIKKCKDFEDVKSIFNNYCDNYTAYVLEKNVSHTQITMKLNKIYIHRIITGNCFMTRPVKLITIAEKPYVTDISSDCTIRNNIYFSNSINTVIERLKFCESVGKLFIYVTYIHPNLETQINLNITNDYSAGNSILSNIFVYNYLYSNGYSHLYNENYTLELLDINFNKITLNQSQYITIYKSYYILKEMAMKMI